MPWGRKHADEPAPGAAGGWIVIGAPLPGTEAAVEAIDCGKATGSAALASVDPAFNADAFVEWSETVFRRAVAAWRSRSPEPLRPVMDEAVWNNYAQHLLAISTVPLAASIMSAARATPHLAGAAADQACQSALIGFEASTDPAVYESWGLDDSHRTWSERWLFQRPASSRTNASGAVAVCPVCGAPAQPEETGRCRYCHADITTRTAGWLVTRTATTLTTSAKMDAHAEKMRAEMREKIASKMPMPPTPPVAESPLQPPRADA
jgi:hypothetical protein